MSKIKFNFEGEAEDLVYILKFMSRGPGDCGHGNCGHGGGTWREEDPEPEEDDLSEYGNPPGSAPIQEHVLKAGWHVQNSVEQAVQAAAKLATDPPYNLDPLTPAVSGNEMQMSMAAQADKLKDFDFGALPLKPEAWAEFVSVIEGWAKNFNVPDAEQADRLKLLTDMGQGRWSIFILRWIAHYKSLQGAVRAALNTNDLDLVAAISGNMLQVAHMSMPDIDGFFDHSTKWRRDALAQIAASAAIAETSGVGTATPSTTTGDK